jgi:hypothetical protein
VAAHGNSVCVPPSTLPQTNPVQHSWVGEQDCASCEQVCGPRQLQLESPAAHGARVVGFWQVTPSPFGQQGFVVEHDSPEFGQVSGIWQLHGSPATQGWAVVAPSGTNRHSRPSPAQQPDVVRHSWPAFEQVATGWQLPLVQASPVQQSVSVPQPWPLSAQLEPDWQVPDVAPPGITQFPAQQSAVLVQVAPSPRHGARQYPLSQLPEQQSESSAQASASPFGMQPQNLLAPEPLQSPKQQSLSRLQLSVGPFGLHCPLVPGSRQRNPNSSVAVQAYCVVPSLQQPVPDGSHAAPNGTQLVVGGVQRRMPVESGTQGLPLQH